MKKTFYRILVNCILFFVLALFPTAYTLFDKAGETNLGARTFFAQAADSDDEVLPPEDPFKDSIPGLDDGLGTGFGEVGGATSNGGDTLVLFLIIMGMIAVAVVIAVAATKWNGRHRYRKYSFDVHYKAKKNLEERLKKEEEEKRQAEEEKEQSEENSDSAKAEK